MWRDGPSHADSFPQLDPNFVPWTARATKTEAQRRPEAPPQHYAHAWKRLILIRYWLLTEVFPQGLLDNVVSGTSGGPEGVLHLTNQGISGGPLRGKRENGARTATEGVALRIV